MTLESSRSEYARVDRVLRNAMGKNRGSAAHLCHRLRRSRSTRSPWFPSIYSRRHWQGL